MICSKDENNSVQIDVTGCKNLSALKIVAVEETLFRRPSCQLLAICYNSSLLRQTTSKIICTSAVAGAKISFALWLRKFSSLGILQNFNVLKSALKHKHVEKKLGSVRGRKATVDALIGNEHYPIWCLNQYIGQCVGRYSIK